jgi:hypothetical protein
VVWPLSAASRGRYHSIALGIILFLVGSATLLLPVAIMAKPLSWTNRPDTAVGLGGAPPLSVNPS